MKKKSRSLKKKQSAKTSASDAEGMQLEYDYHLPVMLMECSDYLLTDPDGEYVDGTLGGGGHTAEILRRLSERGVVHAFDLDVAAIEHTAKRFSSELAKGAQSRLILHNESFLRACSIKEGVQKLFLSGLLLDLGVSSRQLDSDSIGLSYRVDSRLNMRYGSHGIPAEDLLTGASEEELAHILYMYGEEPHARKIARHIVQRRVLTPITTTFQLRAIIEECAPPSAKFKTLSRVFQALRIAVNDELSVLEQTLRGIVPLLRSGARIVVLSYHSLEDRIVKNVFRELARRRIEDPGNPRSTTKKIEPTLRIITKRPLAPQPSEITGNPRSRSAKLRVAEKV